jgi:hypothetical protein
MTLRRVTAVAPVALTSLGREETSGDGATDACISANLIVRHGQPGFIGNSSLSPKHSRGENLAG